MYKYRGIKYIAILQIKIYPEWNVNFLYKEDGQGGLTIKIYPEWNVNVEIVDKIFMIGELKSTQSGM